MTTTQIAREVGARRPSPTSRENPWPASFALLTLHENCRGGCSHPDCRRTHQLAAEPCAGCAQPIGLDRAHMTRGVVAHLECLAAALCNLVGGAFIGGAPTGPRPARSLSAGVILPPPTFNLPDSREVEPCAPASTLATSQAVA